MPRIAPFPAFAVFPVSPGIVAPAHPGGLDANGRHYQNDTGRYHCHRTAQANKKARAAVKKSRENVCPGATFA